MPKKNTDYEDNREKLQAISEAIQQLESSVQMTCTQGMKCKEQTIRNIKKIQAIQERLDDPLHNPNALHSPRCPKVVRSNKLEQARLGPGSLYSQSTHLMRQAYLNIIEKPPIASNSTILELNVIFKDFTNKIVPHLWESMNLFQKNYTFLKDLKEIVRQYGEILFSSDQYSSAIFSKEIAELQQSFEDISNQHADLKIRLDESMKKVEDYLDSIKTTIKKLPNSNSNSDDDLSPPAFK